jgi:hypothetical protein
MKKSIILLVLFLLWCSSDAISSTVTIDSLLRQTGRPGLKCNPEMVIKRGKTKIKLLNKIEIENQGYSKKEIIKIEKKLYCYFDNLSYLKRKLNFTSADTLLVNLDFVVKLRDYNGIKSLEIPKLENDKDEIENIKRTIKWYDLKEILKKDSLELNVSINLIGTFF